MHQSPILDSLNIGWPEVLELEEDMVMELLERLTEARRGTARFWKKRGPGF